MCESFNKWLSIIVDHLIGFRFWRGAFGRTLSYRLLAPITANSHEPSRTLQSKIKVLVPVKACVVPSRKPGGGAVMDWESFAAESLIDLLRPHGVVRLAVYNNQKSLRLWAQV